MEKHPKVRDDVEDLDDEITDEVVPSSPRLERVKKKSFYPWHKPRKQYVRNIWKNNVKSLLRKIKGLKKIMSFVISPFRALTC